ncbi:MAG: 2-amino-4-hydroxy-6-hydroxymethyldihydropteridine diphosphokinase [Kiritimatiellia bacterium]
MQIKPHAAILSLGSNLGKRIMWMGYAADAIDSLTDTHITARSSIYETEPVDVPEKFRDEYFLNAVLLVETILMPHRLSAAVHSIEARLQRRRDTPNQPRTIDIDIISFDRLISDKPSLILPHPRAHERRFVLQPLSEIAPDLILPKQKKNVRALLKTLPETPAVRISPEQWTE